MNEAGVVLVMKMRDEASAELANFGRSAGQSTIQTSALKSSLSSTAGEMDKFGHKAESARLPTSRFRYETIALGAAFTSVGALIGRLDSPMSKFISNSLMTTGAIIMTISAIVRLLPYLSSLVESLQNVAVMQSIVKALSGPAGWLTLAGGLGVGLAAGYGITAMTAKPTPTGTVINNYVQGSVVTESQISQMTRRQIVLTQGRNAGRSGIQ